MQGLNSAAAGYLVVNGQGVLCSCNDKRRGLAGMHASIEDVSYSVSLLMVTEDGSDILVDGDRVSCFVVENEHRFGTSNVLVKWDELFAAVINNRLMFVYFSLHLSVVFVDAVFSGFTQFDIVQGVGFLDEAVAEFVIWPEIMRGGYFRAIDNLLVRVHGVSYCAAQCGL